MGKRNRIWERMTEQTTYDLSSVAWQTIIEIAGEQRVLIENHRGVISYGREKVIVKTKYGSIAVCGCCLEIVHMSKEQVVIFGRIQNISLHRREA